MGDGSQIGPPRNEGTKRIPNPGILGLDLSIVNTHINELHHDELLSKDERHLYMQYYFHEREKIQQQLRVLTKQEQVEACEQILVEKQRAVDFASSEQGRAEARRKWQTQLQGAALSSGSIAPYQASLMPKTSEECEQRAILAAEDERVKAHAALVTARSEYEFTRRPLEGLTKAEGTWAKHQPEIKEWERKQDWETITPMELKPAVKALRKKFDHHTWQCRRSTEVLCHEALHPQGPTILKPADATAYKKYLVTFLGEKGRQLFLGRNLEPPAIFKQYLDAYHTGVKILIAVIFQEFLDIAVPQGESLKIHPIQWAKKHLQILIKAEKTDVKLWVKEVCDGQELFQQIENTDPDENIYWGRWRAPRLIHMQPAGNTHYIPAASWIRENLEDSQRMLEGRGANFTTFLEIALDEIVAGRRDFTPSGTPQRPSLTRRPGI